VEQKPKSSGKSLSAFFAFFVHQPEKLFVEQTYMIAPFGNAWGRVTEAKTELLH